MRVRRNLSDGIVKYTENELDMTVYTDNNDGKETAFAAMARRRSASACRIGEERS